MVGKLPNSASASSPQLQKRFRDLAQERLQSRKIVESIESMGEAILSLDGTEFDLDAAEDSVAIERDGLLGFVDGVKDLGLVFSLNILNERGSVSKEYSKEMTFLSEPDNWGDTYKVISRDETEVVVQNRDGLLTYHLTTGDN